MSDRPRYWTPLVKLRPDETFRRREVVEETMKHYGISADEATAMLDAEDAKCECYVNDIYQVQTQPIALDDSTTILHINVRRRDGGAIFDWRHMQQIKNELAGPEREGFDLYPAESRKVDTSNKYHIWVLPEGARMPVGWTERDVQYDENRNVPGLRQRAL
jgi:hypothetical protein